MMRCRPTSSAFSLLRVRRRPRTSRSSWLYSISSGIGGASIVGLTRSVGRSPRSPYCLGRPLELRTSPRGARSPRESPERGGRASPERAGRESPERGGRASPERAGRESPERGARASPERGGRASPERGGRASPERGGRADELRGRRSSPLSLARDGFSSVAMVLRSGVVYSRLNGRRNDEGPPSIGRPFVERMSRSDLLSHTLASAVPSAQRGLASGFGMGPGVSLSLWLRKLYGDILRLPDRISGTAQWTHSITFVNLSVIKLSAY